MCIHYKQEKLVADSIIGTLAGLLPVTVRSAGRGMPRGVVIGRRNELVKPFTDRQVPSLPTFR